MAYASEKFSLTPSTAGVTVVLNNTSLQVTDVELSLKKTATNVNVSSGFDDGNLRAAHCSLDDTIKDSGRVTTASVYAKKNVGGVPTVAVNGKVDVAKFSNVGEIEFSFATADAGYIVDGIARGNI